MASRSTPSLTSQIARIRTTTPATGRPCESRTRPRTGTSSRTSRSAASPRLTSVAGLDPGRCESRRGGRDLGLVPTGHAAASTSHRSHPCPARNGTGRPHPSPPHAPSAARPSGRSRSNDVRHSDARRPRRRRPACRRGRAPGRGPGMCRPRRRSRFRLRNGGLGRWPGGGAGGAVAPCGDSCPSETRAADAPQPIRPAASRAADADASFWSNMILNTS